MFPLYQSLYKHLPPPPTSLSNGLMIPGSLPDLHQNQEMSSKGFDTSNIFAAAVAWHQQTLLRTNSSPTISAPVGANSEASSSDSCLACQDDLDCRDHGEVKRESTPSDSGKPYLKFSVSAILSKCQQQQQQQNRPVRYYIIPIARYMLGKVHLKQTTLDSITLSFRISYHLFFY
jgi:hypothetical protein